jgi:hypothetical protein
MLFLAAFADSHGSMSKEEFAEMQANLTGQAIENKGKKSRKQELELSHSVGQHSVTGSEDSGQGRKGMVLPFAPLSLTFNNIRYSVDMPEVNFLSVNFKFTKNLCTEDY